ncbi:MAG TPA: helix-turn-helix domain-containing protein, partial [Deltaproteobacteria bacterium]|nr:helix-turn-helix domain-containing protein [Deltaproteobacteria bacterium]
QFLVQFFLKRFNKKYNTNKTVSREAMDHLITYPWPGNVREVANVIERLVVVTHEDYILPGHLPSEIFKKNSQDFSCHGLNLDGLTLKEQIGQIEIDLIKKAIEKYGSARRAAPHLGMDPTSLTRKIKKRGS